MKNPALSQTLDERTAIQRVARNPRLHQWVFLVPRRGLANASDMDRDNKFETSHNTMARRHGKTTGGTLGIGYTASLILGEAEIYKMGAGSDVDSHDPVILYTASTREAARNIIWQELSAMMAMFKCERIDNARMEFQIPRPLTGDRLLVKLMSASDHHKIRGIPGLRKIFADEAQTISEEAFKTSFFPAMQDTRGEMVTAGTATSVGYYRKMISEAVEAGVRTSLLPATMANVFTPSRLAEIRLEQGEAAFRQEFLCDFSVANSSSFWNGLLSELEASPHFFEAQRQPGRTRVMAVDLGMARGFAAWTAEVDYLLNHVDIRDFHSDYVLMERLRADLEGWIPDLILLPHDAKTRQIGAARVRTPLDVFKEVFPESLVYPLQRVQRRAAMIEMATRHMHLLRFPRPGTPFELGTGRGRILLKQFRTAETKAGRKLDRIEKSDSSSHCADALMYLLRGLGASEGQLKTRWAPVARGATGVDMRTDWARSRERQRGLGGMPKSLRL